MSANDPIADMALPIHAQDMTRPANDTEQEVLRAEEELRQAMLRGDTGLLATMLSDDLVFTNQSGARLTKADDLAAHASGLLTIHRIDFDDLHVRIIASSAVATVTATLVGAYAGQGFNGTFAYTRFWSQGGTRWIVEAAHCSAVS